MYVLQQAGRQAGKQNMDIPTNFESLKMYYRLKTFNIVTAVPMCSSWYFWLMPIVRWLLEAQKSRCHSF